MKRIISLLLAVVMMILMTTTSFAANTDKEYYTVQVEYSDNIGHQEELDVMIQNNNVFVDAKMLAERLGYTFGENGEFAIIYNKDISNGLPVGITQFKYNSTQVSHMLFNNMIDAYEAPFASVKNSEGSWIPLEYSLLLINSGIMITDDALLIDIPTKRIVDYFYDIAKNSEKYNFDWADDFGYTETDIKVLGGSSHLINVFNGLLEFDGASWTTLFQQFAGSMASYDKKYGENLVSLLCTESDKELQASIEKVELLTDLLDVDGDLGKLLSFTSDMADFEVGTLYRQCEAVLEGIKTGNSSAIDYSRSYQALENALDRQTWFSHTGGNILEVQKGVSSATGKAFKFLDVGMKVAEVVGYTQEFQNQDKFSLAALTYYLDTKDGGLELPEAMKKSMIDYSDALSSNIAEYTIKRFTENVDQWIIDEIPMHEVLGTQAAAVLFAWNIASNTIPFIANGLSGADSFELALYSLVFQGDTYLNYLGKRDSVFADAGNITAENLYDIAQYCYIYLKSCYTTREAALASLANKSSSTKEKIQPLIDYQNSINTEIAKIMVELKGANKANDSCVFGFLLENNEKYLNNYNNSQLAAWIIKHFVTGVYSENGNDDLDNPPAEASQGKTDVETTKIEYIDYYSNSEKWAGEYGFSDLAQFSYHDNDNGYLNVANEHLGVVSAFEYDCNNDRHKELITVSLLPTNDGKLYISPAIFTNKDEIVQLNSLTYSTNKLDSDVPVFDLGNHDDIWSALIDTRIFIKDDKLCILHFAFPSPDGRGRSELYDDMYIYKISSTGLAVYRHYYFHEEEIITNVRSGCVGETVTKKMYTLNMNYDLSTPDWLSVYEREEALWKGIVQQAVSEMRSDASSFGFDKYFATDEALDEFNSVLSIVSNEAHKEGSLWPDDIILDIWFECEKGSVCVAKEITDYTNIRARV